MYITTRAPALHEMKIPFRVEHFSEIQNFALSLLLIILNAYSFFYLFNPNEEFSTKNTYFSNMDFDVVYFRSKFFTFCNCPSNRRFTNERQRNERVDCKF
jgi:hypothetical protein